MKELGQFLKTCTQARETTLLDSKQPLFGRLRMKILYKRLQNTAYAITFDSY